MPAAPLRLFALLSALQTAVATTVIPPTFDQLVQQAEVIFQGSVTDVFRAEHQHEVRERARRLERGEPGSTKDEQWLAMAAKGR